MSANDPALADARHAASTELALPGRPTSPPTSRPTSPTSTSTRPGSSRSRSAEPLLGELTRCYGADRRRRAGLGPRMPPAGSLELDGDRRPHRRARGARGRRPRRPHAVQRPHEARPRPAHGAATALGARITDELSHLAMGSATRSSVAVEDRRDGSPAARAATTSRSGSPPAGCARAGGDARRHPAVSCRG